MRLLSLLLSPLWASEGKKTTIKKMTVTATIVAIAGLIEGITQWLVSRVTMVDARRLVRHEVQDKKNPTRTAG